MKKEQDDAGSFRHRFTMVEVNTGSDNKIFEHTIVNIFLPISFNICFGCSKEPSH